VNRAKKDPPDERREYLLSVVKRLMVDDDNRDELCNLVRMVLLHAHSLEDEAHSRQRVVDVVASLWEIVDAYHLDDVVEVAAHEMVSALGKRPVAA
jgi:hypothetical protein